MMGDLHEVIRSLLIDNYTRNKGIDEDDVYHAISKDYQLVDDSVESINGLVNKYVALFDSIGVNVGDHQDIIRAIVSRSSVLKAL